jgi:hypothetical protein
VRSLFQFASSRHPEHAALIARVLSIPAKRTDRPVVTFLTRPEIQALLTAPDRSAWTGRRDHTLLTVAVQTGLRVSELTGLRRADIVLGRGAHLRVTGKGRKERVTRFPSTPPPSCRPGSTNEAEPPRPRSFPVRPDTRWVGTPSANSSSQTCNHGRHALPIDCSETCWGAYTAAPQ